MKGSSSFARCPSLPPCLPPSLELDRKENKQTNKQTQAAAARTSDQGW
jgi:hypothetical protein